ncbi:minor tail protein [Gordonia phage Wocket]|nr:minor tail protein [Gordonia phage Wocket]
MSFLRVKVPGTLDVGVDRPTLAEPLDPIAYFGAALMAWFDPSLGTDGATVTSLTDRSANNKHGSVIVGAPVYDADGLGGTPSVSFNGSSSIATATGTPYGTGAVTLAVNAQANTTGATQYICDSSATNNLAVIRSSSTGWQARRNGAASALLPSPNINDAVPHSIVAVFDGASSKLFLDGVQVAANDQGVGTFTTTLKLGCNGAGANFLTGKIGDYLLINRALTGPEVTQVSDWMIDRRTV